MKYASALSVALFATSIYANLPIDFSQASSRATALADSSNKIESLQLYKVKDFSHLLGMPGFSDHALRTHFKLYEGYVKNTNLLIALINQLIIEGRQSSPLYQEMKRRFGWEFDGIQLHELYFSNLGGKTPLNPTSALSRRLVQDFGSIEAWQKDFVETGMIRGVGWVVLYQDPIVGRLINTWIGEHDIGHLAGGVPILIMDVWEHAFMLDYGIDRRAYIKAFMDNINWEIASLRFKGEK